MKQLLILSGKGGTGKTTVAGAFIKLFDAKVYCDCDVDAPNLHLITSEKAVPKKTDYYGLPKSRIDQEKCKRCNLCYQNCRFNGIKKIFSEDNNTVKYVVDTVNCEGCGVCALVCKYNAIEIYPYISGELILYEDNIKVFSTAKLKMGSGTSGKLVSQVKNQVKESDKASDAEIVIIDGSPGIGCPVIASLSGADLALIVAEPSISGLSDMKRVIKTANNFLVKVFVCVNKYDTNLEKTQEIYKYCKNNDIEFVGKIPFDKKAVGLTNEGKTLVEEETISGKAIKEVYEYVFEYLKTKSK